MSPESHSVPVSCNKDCGAGCPLWAHVEDGRIVKIINNPAASSYLKGCSKGLSAMQPLSAPERLRQPLIRSGPRGSGEFRELSWPRALDYVAEKLAQIKTDHGRDSILFLGGSGACRGALHNTYSLTQRFLNILGCNIKKYGNYSSAASDFVTPYVFGTMEVGMDAATLQHSEMIILWGANIADTRFGCEYPARIREAARNGVPVIVIDPRKSNSATFPQARWIKVRPGTDAALMAAVLYELIDHELVDLEFLESHCLGFDQVRDYVLGTVDQVPKTTAWAEQICGTEATIVKELALAYGQAKPAALIPGLSIQRTIGGEEAMRMAMVLQAATGNIGKLGGSSGGCIWDGLPGPECGEIDTLEPEGEPLFSEYLWPDVVLEGRTGGFPVEVQAIYNVGGNYLSQGSDLHKNIRAFEKVEFSVCHEQFMTPTARYCDIILPVSAFLEREDILFTGMNYLFYSAAAVDPPADVRDDYEIFCELADRLGFSEQFSEGKSASQWIEQFIEESEIEDSDQFRRTGIYRAADQERVGLSAFMADPVANPLHTPSGKIELASEDYAHTGYPAVPEYRGKEVDERYPLQLITPHALHRINSSYANLNWFKQKEKQVLWMHPHDASSRNIVDQQMVQVANEQGATRIPVMITDDIMAGVVCLGQGNWPDLDATGIDHGGAVNILTSTEPTRPSMGSRTHSVVVEVTPGAAAD